MSGKYDFFISRRGADSHWAEWIAWTLEEAGYTTFLQDWDFGAGTNIPGRMQTAASAAERTIVVLSPDYFDSRYTQAEWLQRFFEDPDGTKRAVIPIRVRPCQPTGLLACIRYIDLTDKDESDATEEITRQIASIFGGRLRPASKPKYPGGGTCPDFPGTSHIDPTHHGEYGPRSLTKADFAANLNTSSHKHIVPPRQVKSGHGRPIGGAARLVSVRVSLSNQEAASEAFAAISECLSAVGVIVSAWQVESDGRCSFVAVLPSNWQPETVIQHVKSAVSVESITAE